VGCSKLRHLHGLVELLRALTERKGQRGCM
jgi:hypothetical protein